MTSFQPFTVFHSAKNSECIGFDAEDSENIPYHAREYARPFTYGFLPETFKSTELNHVTFEKTSENPKPTRGLPASPSMLRKSSRPSISPSRPVLRKTPSRQEFEEMLMERREQSMREQNNVALKLAQNAAIQKDLDELQERLNKSGVVLSKNMPTPTTTQKSDTMVTDIGNMQHADSHEEDLTTKPMMYESDLFLVEQHKRSETPSFPLASKSSSDERCISPYPSTPPAQQTAIMAYDSQSENSNTKIADKNIITDPQDVESHLVKFAKDFSEFWYKPHMTREESVALLRHAAPGTFIIRNSTTYKNAYGLVLRVAKPPPGVNVLDDVNGDELVRHFLIEPTTRGVRLKGCANEPNFTSLSALVYQHSINPLVLPCELIIPAKELLHVSGDVELIAAQKQLLTQGAACNVLYLFTCDMELLTGDEAIRKAVNEAYALNPLPQPIVVHFKVSQQGITLTDNTRRLFFRRHYTAQNISHVGADPDGRMWVVAALDEGQERAVNKTIFGFIARPLTGARNNQCHVFCDLAASQPASAIVSFTNKVLPMNKHLHQML